MITGNYQKDNPYGNALIIKSIKCFFAIFHDLCTHFMDHFSATIALIIGSEQIISALFGYGSFNESSVSNSSLALYYFALGLPAFALIKVFSSFFFANHDTKTPFYISLISVLVNIFISLYYFSEIGFIIIPIATSISSWFNSILLFLFLKNRQLFYFNQIFFIKFIKIE